MCVVLMVTDARPRPWALQSSEVRLTLKYGLTPMLTVAGNGLTDT